MLLCTVLSTIYLICSFTQPHVPQQKYIGVTVDTPNCILQTVQLSTVVHNVYGTEGDVVTKLSLDDVCVGVYFDDCYAFAVTKETARRFLDYLDNVGNTVIQQHADAVGVRYSKNITFMPIEDIDNKYVMPYDDVIAYVTRDDVRYKTLIVTPTDTVDTVAEQLHVNVDTLCTYNATFNDVMFAGDWARHALVPGTKVSYPIMEPYLSTYYVEEGIESVSEELDPEVIYDDSLYEDELITEDKGEPRISNATYQYVYDSSNQLISKELVTQVVYSNGRQGKVRIGTKPTRIMADITNVKEGEYFSPIIDSSAYISAYMGDNRGHKGIDIAAPYATPIYAATSGTVSDAAGGWNGGYGNAVVIDNDDGNVCRYAHMSWFVVNTGDYVVKGQLIGYVGSTGNSDGNHCHFEVICNNVHRNPLNYITFPAK